MRPQREAKATGRELQILELAAEGNTDKQIASNLGISKDTVASYWRRILLKYDAASRTEVVARHAEQKAMEWVKEQGEEAVRLASEVSVRTKAEARELDQRNLLQAITECSLDFISGKRGYREVFDRYLQELLGLTQSEFGFLGEVKLDADGNPYLVANALTDLAASREARRKFDDWRESGLEFRNLDSLFGKILSTQSVIIEEDCEDSSDCDEIAVLDLTISTYLGIPVFSDEEMVGVIGLGNRPGGYDQQIVDYLAPLIATCANYIVGWRAEIDRRAIEAQLTETAMLLKTLTDAMPTAFLFEDVNRKLQYVNRSFLEIFGSPQSPTELIGANCAEIAKLSLPIFADPNGFLERVDELLARKQSVFGDLVKFADGRMYERDFVVVRENRKRLGYLWKYNDVTERRAQHETFHNVLSASMDGVVVISNAGIVEYWNSRAEKIFGYTAEEAMGKLLADLIVPEQYKAAHEEGLRRYKETRVSRVMGQIIKIHGLNKAREDVHVELLLSCIDTGAAPRYSAFIRKV